MADLLISSFELEEIRKKAFRRRVWFRVLDRSERAIVNLTIRYVEKIRSQKLTNIVNVIVAKLGRAIMNRIERLMQTVGRSLAQKISHFAHLWGNVLAERWATDVSFMRFLTIMQLEKNRVY